MLAQYCRTLRFRNFSDLFFKSFIDLKQGFQLKYICNILASYKLKKGSYMMPIC